jgi:hypothetical protein
MEQTLLSDHRLRLDRLLHEGRALRVRLQTDHASPGTIGAIRSWQEACATAVNELSGGSKAHWLARAFSEAFLVRSSAGEAVQQAPLADIVERIVGVLDRGSQSLALVAEKPTNTSQGAAPQHRFDFVHNATLRPLLEQAYLQGRTAFDEGRFAESLMTACGVLEAILTDALEFIGREPHEWSFQMRIDEAEQAGLIRGGCARLPPIARNYRELTDADGQLHGHVSVTVRDASTTSQVLHVVMRDLNPGR